MCSRVISAQSVDIRVWFLGYALEKLIGLDIFQGGRERKSVVRVRSSLCVCVGADVPWPWAHMLLFWDWCKNVRWTGRISTGGTIASGHLIGFDLGLGRSVSTCAMAAFSVSG